MIGGLLLAVTANSTILDLVGQLTQDELREDRADFIATHLLAWAEAMSVQTQHFYAFYLLSHGAVKLALVAGLLRGKLWAYPASLAVMSLFIAYQLYRFSYTHALGLIALVMTTRVAVKGAKGVQVDAFVLARLHGTGPLRPPSP